MSHMDNDEVLPGDRVWDTQEHSWGTVQNVYDDHFSVLFGRRKRSVNYEGIMDGRNHKTVFWGQVDFFRPRKNPLIQAKQRRAIKKVMEIFDDYLDTKTVEVRD